MPNNVTVTSNEAATFQVNATDADVGDTLTYSMVEDLGDVVRIDSNTGQITATVVIDQPVNLQ